MQLANFVAASYLGSSQYGFRLNKGQCKRLHSALMNGFNGSIVLSRVHELVAAYLQSVLTYTQYLHWKTAKYYPESSGYAKSIAEGTDADYIRRLRANKSWDYKTD